MTFFVSASARTMRTCLQRNDKTNQQRKRNDESRSFFCFESFAFGQTVHVDCAQNPEAFCAASEAAQTKVKRADSQIQSDSFPGGIAFGKLAEMTIKDGLRLILNEAPSADKTIRPGSHIVCQCVNLCGGCAALRHDAPVGCRG